MGKKRLDSETGVSSVNQNTDENNKKAVKSTNFAAVTLNKLESGNSSENLKQNNSKEIVTENAIETNSTFSESSLSNSRSHSPLVNTDQQSIEASEDAIVDKNLLEKVKNSDSQQSIKSEFKLRVVPIEKLLAKPYIHTYATESNLQKKQHQSKKRALRERNDTSIIELTDSSECDSEQESVKNLKSNNHQSIEVKNKQDLSKHKKLRSRRDSRSSSGGTSSSANIQFSSKRSRARLLCSDSEDVDGDDYKKVNNKKSEKTPINRKSKTIKVQEEKGQDNRVSNTTEIEKTKLTRSDSINDNSSDTDQVNSANLNIVEPKRSSFKLRRAVVRVKRVKLHSGIQNKLTRKNNMDQIKPSSSFSTRKHNDGSGEDADSDFATHAETDVGSNDDACSMNSSDSEVMPQPRKRVFKSKKRADSDDSDFEPEGKSKKRRRIKRNSTDDDSDSDGDEKNKNKRKHIRKIISTKDLDISTKNATKEEEDRRKRIEERQKVYNKIFEKPENIEINELVLDFDEKSQKALLQVDKGLLKKLKPHQVAGVKFMWDACFETLNDADEKPGSGCILAHCMGLGKTLQVVTLSHTLLANSRRTNVERVLIISPLSTLNNWAREFVYWMGFAHKKDIEVYDISRYKDKPTRIFKLYEWCQEGGVCILGYDMYRILANEKAKGLRKKQREQLQQALVNPGPDLVVCDEGHLLKNEKTSISKAVTKMRTKRRIVLTGTPLQNNLKEYYCMIQFIKPNLLGTYKEYMNRFVNPITNGQYTDSTERDIRLMKHRSHILHKLLEGCIQRRDYCVLAPYLPPKHEYVIYTTLSELQQALYEYYMTTQRDLISSDISGKGARLFQDFQDLRRIWTHPMNLRVNSDTVIAKRLINNEESEEENFICDESETEMSNSTDSEQSLKSDGSAALPSRSGTDVKSKKRKTRNAARNAEENDSHEEQAATSCTQKDDPSEWWKRFVDDKELNNIHHSPKLVILMKLLQQCEAIGDKLLVFSQSLQSLDVIEHFLSLIDSNTHNYEFEGDVGNFKGIWKLGVDYFRLDGSSSVEQRESMCKKFNDTSNLRARLFLISTRAGGLGINLVAANRVVIFDVSWNPSHDTQSIFRVYRFGQSKPCYIYRLIAMGTMEQKVYERQVAKQATAKRVIDEQQISRHYNQTDLMELYTYELVPSIEKELPILPKDRLFAELLSEHDKLIFKYHEHDSLLEQEENENLTETERKAAWDEYEAEKTRTVQTAQYMSFERGAFGNPLAGQFGNPSGSVTSNKIFGFRSDILLQLLNMKIAKDYPDMSQNQVIQMVPTYLQVLYTQMNNGDPSMYKDLLQLHSTIVHPSGMYMNPLLYANQNPSAAGYFQASNPHELGQPHPHPNTPTRAPGFEPDKVYEID